MQNRVKLKKTLVGLVIAVLLVSFNVNLVFPQSSTIVVPDDFSTIQEAVDFAKSGDTIYVRAGTYSESVVINKNRLTLTGENKQTAIIDGGAGTNQTLRVDNADFVTISGFTIQNTYDGICFYESSFGSVTDCIITTCSFRGIILILASFNSISGNILNDNHDGVELYKSSFNVVSGNTITNSRFGIATSRSFNDTFTQNTILNSQSGIYIWDCSYDTASANIITNNAEHGISLVVSSYCTFSENTITNNAIRGISLGNCSYCFVSENTIISSAHQGAHAYYSFKISFTKNTLINNNNGLGIFGSTYCTFTENTMQNSAGRGISIGNSSLCLVSENLAIASANQGIHMFYSSDITVTNNTLTDNRAGVGLYWASQSTVFGNTITAGKFGFTVTSSDNNHFYHNSVFDNERSVITNSTSIWDDGPVSGGNYWSDYTGTDANGDGIGDTPYVIDELNQDNYPLMSPDGINQVSVYFNLLVNSLPSGVNFTANGTIHTAPWSQTFVNSTEINLEMPEFYLYDGKNYTWSQWNDENTNRTRTIVITENTTLIAVYAVENVSTTVSVVSPQNTTYTTNQVPLQFATTQSNNNATYSLDNQQNVTVAGNTTLNDLSNGPHSVIVFVEDDQGNVTASETVYFTVAVVSVGFALVSPENITYNTADVPLIYTKNETCNSTFFVLDGQQNYTDPGTITLSGLGDGSHQLVAYVNYTGSVVGEEITVNFTVNTTVPDSPPLITVISPVNTTYTSGNIPLNFTVNQQTTWLAYSLDGQENVTITGNTTLTDLSEGLHSLVVYANSTTGSIGSSNITCFTVTVPVVGVTILSPQNTTYNTSEIPLDYLVNQTCTSVVYSLDGQPTVDAENVTLLSGISDGIHELTVTANFTVSNASESDTVSFTVDTTPTNITSVTQVPVNVTGTFEDGAKINATVIDIVAGVKSVSLNYTDGNGTWTVIPMDFLVDTIWNTTIPGFPHGTNVTYVIIAEDFVGNKITSEELFGTPNQYQVLPEFVSWLVLPLFLTMASLGTLYKKRLYTTKPQQSLIPY